MKNINDNRNYQAIQLSSPAVEILLCRRALLEHWEVAPSALRPYWRIYRPWNDAATLICKGQEFPMRTGDIWLIAPETEFDAAQSGPFDKLYLHFLVDGDLANCRDFCIRLEASPALDALAERVSAKLLAGESAGFRLELEASALVTAALALIPERYLVQYRPVESGLIAVWRLIQQNPSRGYTNSELAAIAKMGLSTFIRRFTLHFGISPQHFVLEQKIRSATLLLIRTELSIAEIAESCGFCDIYHFSRMFRKFRGMPPLTFRKHHRVSG